MAGDMRYSERSTDLRQVVDWENGVEIRFIYGFYFKVHLSYY